MENLRTDPETSRTGDGNLWDHAQREYLSGVTATTICQRYGMSLRSFRLQARSGGWRRMDRADCDIPPEPGEYHRDDDVSFSDLADEAFLNIRRSLGSGRAAEASSWMRLFDKFADRARSQVMADLPDLGLPEPEPASVHEPLLLVAVVDPETTRESSVVQDDLDSSSQDLHLSHGVFSECTPALADPEAPASTASETLDDLQRAARLLLRSRRLEHNLGVFDVDEQLNALGPDP